MTKDDILYPEGTPAEKRRAKWDARWMSLVDVYASYSGDPSRRVGCVIVDPSQLQVSEGWNDLPRGVADADWKRERDTGAKLLWTEHAERNAIYNATRKGASTIGCTIYTNFFPCADCARAIIQAGIVEIVSLEPDLAHPNWGDHFRASQMMFEEAGVVFRALGVS